MSELPRLDIYVKSEFGEPTFPSNIKNQVILLSDLKKQIAFYEKYKDNIELFLKDYPNYKEYWEQRFNTLKLCCVMEYLYVVYYREFKDWLFNKLFKEGIV